MVLVYTQPHYIVQFEIDPIHDHNFTDAITEFLSENSITIQNISSTVIS